MEIEVWKDVVGYEGRYQVSNLGRVRSVSRIVNKPRGLTRPVESKILSFKKNKNRIFQNITNRQKYHHTAGGYIWRFAD